MYLLGELPPAQAHLEQGLALYAPQEHRALAFHYGLDLGVWCRSYVAWPLGLLGYPDQALTRIHEALTLAQELSHPISLAAALYYAVLLHYLRREGPAAQEYAEAAIALSNEQGFPLYLALGTNVRGWALSVQGHAEEGMAQMCQGRAALQAMGAKLWWPAYLAWLAEAYDGMGQATEGLTVLTEALTTAHNTGERFWEAELHRRKGALLLALSAEQHAEAETCFHQALNIARRQQAKSLELRAAVSLSRLWQQQGKWAEAYALLAPIYGWFTEGFDTADLQEAKTLLEELSQ
jgi:predicted ATPase